MICQLVLEYFQLQLSDILFFLEAFGLFGIFWPSKGLTAFLRPKNPKKASGLQKKQNVFKLQLKILQKKLTHHEKMPAFFLSLVPYHIDAHSSMILYIIYGGIGLEFFQPQVNNFIIKFELFENLFPIVLFYSI